MQLKGSQVSLPGWTQNAGHNLTAEPFCFQVEEARAMVESELVKVLETSTGLWREQASLPAFKPVALYDSVNNAVWLKLNKKSPVRVFPSSFCSAVIY
jgi:hypothetical protein